MSFSGNFEQLNRVEINAKGDPFNLNITNIEDLELGNEEETKEIFAELNSLKLGEKFDNNEESKILWFYWTQEKVWYLFG